MAAGSIGGQSDAVTAFDAVLNQQLPSSEPFTVDSGTSFLNNTYSSNGLQEPQPDNDQSHHRHPAQQHLNSRVADAVRPAGWPSVNRDLSISTASPSTIFYPTLSASTSQSISFGGDTSTMDSDTVPENALRFSSSFTSLNHPERLDGTNLAMIDGASPSAGLARPVLAAHSSDEIADYLRNQHGDQTSDGEMEDDHGPPSPATEIPKPRRGGRKRKDPEDLTGEAKVKRDRALEKNRAAASKCRQKKKIHSLLLEQDCRRLIVENKMLKSQVMQLKSERLSLLEKLVSLCGASTDPEMRDYLTRHLAQQVTQSTHGYTLSQLGMSSANGTNNTVAGPSSPRLQMSPATVSREGSTEATPVSLPLEYTPSFSAGFHHLNLNSPGHSRNNSIQTAQQSPRTTTFDTAATSQGMGYPMTFSMSPQMPHQYTQPSYGMSSGSSPTMSNHSFSYPDEHKIERVEDPYSRSNNS